MSDKYFDNEKLNKAISGAVSVATYLKKEDERFEGVNPMVPLHVGILDDGRPYITIACADSNGKEPQVVVLTEQMAAEIVREVGACLSVLRADKDKKE